VKPYYLHHPDLVKGTGHFRTDIACGLDIMARLRGRLSGMGIPHYMIDLPGGGGKVPLVPDFIAGEENGMLKIAGLNGKMYFYPKTGSTGESINRMEKAKGLP
jgi:lysine 2,3-aminomutase